MPLRHDMSEANFNIEASKIEAVEPVVIKQLLPDIDQSMRASSNEAALSPLGNQFANTIVIRIRI